MSVSLESILGGKDFSTVSATGKGNNLIIPAGQTEATYVAKIESVSANQSTNPKYRGQSFFVIEVRIVRGPVGGNAPDSTASMLYCAWHTGWLERFKSDLCAIVGVPTNQADQLTTERLKAMVGPEQLLKGITVEIALKHKNSVAGKPIDAARIARSIPDAVAPDAPPTVEIASPAPPVVASAPVSPLAAASAQA